MGDPVAEAKFTKSLSNRASENAALKVLLTDRRFQAIDSETRWHLLSLIGVSRDAGYGARTFDAVMTPRPVEPLTKANIGQHLEGMRLIEMKATRKPIEDARLNNFFFGATDNEFRMARDLGRRYLFAFVVLNETNRYGRPFAVLLTLEQLDERTGSKRTQYQVNLRRDIPEGAVSQEVVVLGEPDPDLRMVAEEGEAYR
jgi:hypothetical protein